MSGHLLGCWNANDGGPFEQPCDDLVSVVSWGEVNRMRCIDGMSQSTVLQQFHYMVGNRCTGSVGQLTRRPPSRAGNRHRKSPALKRRFACRGGAFGDHIDDTVESMFASECECNSRIVIFDNGEGWVSGECERNRRQAQETSERTRHVRSENRSKTKSAHGDAACGAQFGSLAFELMKHPAEP